jgi:hypothetical protein
MEDSNLRPHGSQPCALPLSQCPNSTSSTSSDAFGMSPPRLRLALRRGAYLLLESASRTPEQTKAKRTRTQTQAQLRSQCGTRG